MSADDAATMGWVKTISAFLHILISVETLQVETAENVTNSANLPVFHSTNRPLRQCGNLPLWQSADRRSTGAPPQAGAGRCPGCRLGLGFGADTRTGAMDWSPVSGCLRVPLPFEYVHQFGMFDDLGPNLAGRGVVADQSVLNDADLPGRVLVAVPAHERVVDPAAFA